MTSYTKPKVRYITYRIAVGRESSYCSDNMHRKSGDIETRVFGDKCEQTDKQTDTLVTILRTPTGGEVKISK